MGGLVAVFIVTVALFSEKNFPDIAESEAVISVQKDPSEPEEKKSVKVSEPNTANGKIEGDVESKEAEVIKKKLSD